MSVCLSVCLCICPTVRDHNPIHLSNKSPFSSINFLINQLYSSLAQLIATFKTFCLVFLQGIEKVYVFQKTAIKLAKTRAGGDM